jgi:hypothetical protein
MEFKQRLAYKLYDYFNKSLKETLKYPEIFDVRVATEDRGVLIETKSTYSELIKKLDNLKLRESIEATIQKGMDAVTGDKFTIKIIPISESEFVIQY